MKKFAKEGRLSFVGCGWVEHDESLTEYRSNVLNMVKGMDWVKKHFGVVPKTAWQIDPFGHASNTPDLMEELGFENMVMT